MDPLELFPYEIWTHIFNCLVPATDKLTITSCYYANSTFRPLLEDKLFAEAFSIVDQHLTTRGGESGHLEATDISNLRLVSKLWRRTIDLFTQYHDTNHYQYETKFRSIPVTQLSLETIDRVPEMLRIGRKSSSINQIYNPMYSRYLRVDFGNNLADSTTVSKFQQNLFKLVSTLGHLIWYFECSGNIRGGTLSYRFLYTCISKMANLKALYIDYKHETKGDLVYDRLDDNTYFNSDFPRLKHLTTLALSEAHVNTIFNAVNANQHINKIIIKQNTPAIFQQTWLIKEQAWDLKRLERLHIESTYALCVYYASYSFRRTVKHLSCLIDDPEVSAPLDLPYLEQLSVEINGKVNLDFIIYLKHVHTLRIKMDDPEKILPELDEVPKKVDLPDYLDSCEHSNVWLYLPRLTRLELSFKGSQRSSSVYARRANGFISQIQ